MEQTLKVMPGVVQVLLERGELPQEIVPVLAAAALAARSAQTPNLLVISGVDDPTTPLAVSLAIDGIHAAGARHPLKIAFVACMLPQYSTYHFAERYAEKYGIAAKVLVSVRDARAWLRLPAEAPPPRRPVAEAML